MKPIIDTADRRNVNPNRTNDSIDSHADDEEEDNGQSWHKILDPELQPEQPIPGNKESMEIYADHSRLAKEYFTVETELYFSQNLRNQVLQNMDPEQRKQKEILLQKLKDRVSFSFQANNF